MCFIWGGRGGGGAAFVDGGEQGTPEGSGEGGTHGNKAPVCAEVLQSPDDADEDGDEAEDGTVAEADQGTDRPEARAGVVLRVVARQEELADQEEK